MIPSEKEKLKVRSNYKYVPWDIYSVVVVTTLLALIFNTQISAATKFVREDIIRDIESVLYTPEQLRLMTGQAFSERSVPIWDRTVRVGLVRRSVRPFLPREELYQVIKEFKDVVPANFELGPDNSDLLIVAHDTLFSVHFEKRLGLLREMSFTGEGVVDIARSLEGKRHCAYYVDLYRSARIQKAIIFIDTSGRSNDSEGVINCLYRGIVSVSGFPVSDEILKKYSSSIRKLDRIALDAIYSCGKVDASIRSIVGISCIKSIIPPQAKISIN